MDANEREKKSKISVVGTACPHCVCGEKFTSRCINHAKSQRPIKARKKGSLGIRVVELKLTTDFTD
jgi:hypothetical protein